MKRAEGFVFCNLLRGGFCGGAGGVGVQMNEGVQFGLKRSDAVEVRFEKFERRDLFGAKEGGDFGDGRVVKWGHGRIFESKRRTKMRQGNVAGGDWAVTQSKRSV